MPNSCRNFESLCPVAKEQYIEKLSLLNLTGDTGPYSNKASKNSVHHVFPGKVVTNCCQISYTLPEIPFEISEITEISKSEIKES